MKKIYTDDDFKGKENLIFSPKGKRPGRKTASFRIGEDVLSRWQEYCQVKKLYVLDKEVEQTEDKSLPRHIVVTSVLDKGDMAELALEYLMETFPLNDDEIEKAKMVRELNEKLRQ